MGATDVTELKQDVTQLKKSNDEIKEDLTKIEKKVNDIAEQYHILKHSNGNTHQGVINAQQVLNRLEPLVEKLVEKITGDEKFGNLGIIQILKNQEKFNEEIHKRVTDIEQVNKVEEKIDTYKKNFFRLVWGSIGASVILGLQKLLVYIFHL